VPSKKKEEEKDEEEEDCGRMDVSHFGICVPRFRRRIKLSLVG